MSREEWATQQRDLVEGYESRTVGAERRRVKIQWWTATGKTRRVDLMGSLSQLWSARHAGGDPVLVAVYDATDPIGAPPFLVVKAAPDSFVDASGRALATIVGRPEPGGALLVETRHGAILPTEPLSPAGDDAPPWAEVDTGA
jgi:hypothetical protein